MVTSNYETLTEGVKKLDILFFIHIYICVVWKGKLFQNAAKSCRMYGCRQICKFFFISLLVYLLDLFIAWLLCSCQHIHTLHFINPCALFENILANMDFRVSANPNYQIEHRKSFEGVWYSKGQKWRKGMVHCSTEGNRGSVYRWGLPLRAQLLIPPLGPDWVTSIIIAIIVGPSAAALSGAQNSDFPQRKSALNRYCKNG